MPTVCTACAGCKRDLKTHRVASLRYDIRRRSINTWWLISGCKGPSGSFLQELVLRLKVPRSSQWFPNLPDEQGHLLNMLFLGPHPRPSESESLREGPGSVNMLTHPQPPGGSYHHGSLRNTDSKDKDEHWPSPALSCTLKSPPE